MPIQQVPLALALVLACSHSRCLLASLCSHSRSLSLLLACGLCSLSLTLAHSLASLAAHLFSLALSLAASETRSRFAISPAHLLVLSLVRLCALAQSSSGSHSLLPSLAPIAEQPILTRYVPCTTTLASGHAHHLCSLLLANNLLLSHHSLIILFI